MDDSSSELGQSVIDQIGEDLDISSEKNNEESDVQISSGSKKAISVISSNVKED